MALLAVLCGILALYVSPALEWREQSKTAEAQRVELAEVEQEHDRLESQVRDLGTPAAFERRARELGMVKRGEVPLVVEGLPGTRR